ncbi:hypothetical protein D3C80_1536810 [compost metagenome]
MADHDAFGVAGGAGGVVEGYRLPFRAGPYSLEIRVAFGKQGFVVDDINLAKFRGQVISDDHDCRRTFELLQRGIGHRDELAIHQQ